MTATAPVFTPSRRRIKPPIRRTARNMAAFLALGLVAALLAVAAVVVVYIANSAYQAGHQATPTSAVKGMLYATLHDGDKTSAAKYLCDAAITRQVNTLIDQNDRFTHSGKDTTLSYEWGAPHVVSQHSGQATVTADIDLLVTEHGRQYGYPEQHWTLGLRDHGGWKICSLSITSD